MVEHLRRLGKAADAEAVHVPDAVFAAKHVRAQQAQDRAGIQHILAFEKAFDHGFADRKSAQDQRAMRDRFVAGYANSAR